MMLMQVVPFVRWFCFADWCQIVDSYHDDVCVRLRERMIAAAEKDKQSNDAKLPATAKLAMLDEVMGVLRKCVMHRRQARRQR